jgi:capsular polysaccharide biosynthesis protein
LESDEAPYYPPTFADRRDREFFFQKAAHRRPRLGYTKSSIAIRGTTDCYMLLGRELEGILFDDRGALRCHGYLEACSQLPKGITKEDGQFHIDRSMFEDAPYLSGEHLVFCNGNLQNYYHWLIEAILGLYVLQKSRGGGAKIVLPSSLPRGGNLQYFESIKLFGAARTDFVVTPAPVVKLERAFWIEPSHLIDHVPENWVVDFQSSVANSLGRFAQARRVYIEREESRTVENADEVRAFLEEAGFITVHPIGMSILDQARLFSGATFVIGAHGAGLSNLIFAPRSARVIEFMPNMEMRTFFWMISMKLGHEYGMLPCETDSGGFNGKLRVDVHKLGRLLALLENA